MTFATPELTPVFRVTVKRKSHNAIYMHFEVAADSVAHAEAKVTALIEDKHHVLVRMGYVVRAKRIQRNNQEATVLV